VTYYPAQSWIAAPAQAAGRRSTLIDYIAGAMAVTILLVFSQGWIAPIFGASADHRDNQALRYVASLFV